MRIRSLLPAVVAILLAKGPAQGTDAGSMPIFSNAPVACGMALSFKECRAAFDGWMLSISYRSAEGRESFAIYRKCSLGPDMIFCAEGEWRSGTATGPLPGRSIGLRNGRPFPD